MTKQNTNLSEDWAELLVPGLRTVFYNTYKERPTQFDKIFNVKTSGLASEKEKGMGNLSPWGERINDTDNVDYQKLEEGLLRTFTHKEFASGFAVGKRLVEDEQYSVINKMAEDLGRGGRSKVDTDAFTVLNNAFTIAGYDGVPLFSATHPLASSTDVCDNLATGTLTVANLQLAITKMRKMVDEAGKKIVLMPDTLIVPPALEFVAQVITQSTLKVDSPNNDVNTMAGRFKVQVCDYLTSDTAWFIADSSAHGLTFFWRVKPEFEKATDTDNFVAKYNGRMRYSYGYSDFRGIVGSTGA